LWGSLVLTLILTPLGGSKCRGDEFDDKLKHFQKQRASEALALKGEVVAALSKAHALAHDSPAKAEKLLRPLLARLLDDSQLPREERLALVRQLKGRLEDLQELAAEKAPKEADSVAQAAHAPTGYAKPGISYAWPPTADKKARPTGQGAGGFAGVLRLNTTATVPDGGTVVVGGYGSVVEARNEFGPPLASNVPYANRLFRNVGYGRQTGSVRLLLGVRIISLREEEERFLAQGGSQ
jgi:hypothetical protein